MIKNLLLFILSTIQLFSAEPAARSHLATASATTAPNLLTPLQINLESFISLTPHEGFEVHGADGLHRLYDGTPGDTIYFFRQLQPYMPIMHPVLLTESNRGIFQYLDHALHNGKTVMLMAVFFSEFLGKDIDPVIIYFTRAHVADEILSSDEIFRGSHLGETLFKATLTRYRSTIAQTLGQSVSLNFGHSELPRFIIKLLSDAGIASTQNALGYMYHHGVGVAQDYAEALRLFRLSADQGCADAQNSLGYMYQHGIGVAQNYTEALRLFRLSADQGNATAQNYLGLLKVAGLGCEQNLPEAFSLYRQLALKPDAEPLDKFNYGVFVYFGICTERNTVRGIELMTAALGLNHPRVSYMFHKLHHNSLIEGAAMNEAARYLSLAHDHNVNDAQKLWVETLLDKGQEIAMAEAVRISAESARAVEVAPKQRWWCC